MLKFTSLSLLAALALALALAPVANPVPAAAVNKVKTESIQVPSGEGGAGGTPAEAPEAAPDSPAEPAAAPGEFVPPQVLYDLSLLPAPVARTREQIISAAQTGDIERMRVVLEANEMPPTVSFGGPADPIEFWKTVAGDPDGREVLAIMIEILEAGYVHLDEGTPQEMYVWPYFYGLPLDGLTPSQEVELYKLITPHDRAGMEDFGAYIFYRLGIGPDGTWHFFVAGD